MSRFSRHNVVGNRLTRRCSESPKRRLWHTFPSSSFFLSPAAYFLSTATKSMQKTPLETLGFKTSSFADKSFRLNPAKAGNWRISIIAAAALGDGRDLLFYRGDVPPAGDFLPIAAESHQRTPAETDGFCTSFVVCKSCILNPAETGN